MSFVTLEKVYKRYIMGDITIEAARGMSFEIEKGELAIIVGPSGSGKTTILNILGGMDTCGCQTAVRRCQAAGGGRRGGDCGW